MLRKCYYSIYGLNHWFFHFRKGMVVSMKINKHMAKRLGMMCVGVFCMGLAVTIYNKVRFGTDPFTCMNLGIADTLGLPFGVSQLVINCLVIIFGFIFGRHLIGIGTVMNMVCVGFIADFCTMIYDKFFPDPTTMTVRIIMFAIIVVLHCFGGSIFFTAALGVGAYDILGFVLAEKTKLNYRWCRMTTDLICVIAGFFLGSIIGVGTVVTAFFMGPIIQFFTDHFSLPFLNGREQKEESVA